jgi:hypothetical protein
MLLTALPQLQELLVSNTELRAGAVDRFWAAPRQRWPA